MVSYFPRTTRRWMASVLAVSSVMVGFAAIPLASADDDLKERESRVERDLGAAEQHLDQSSSRLIAASESLAAAREKLGQARSHLARTRGELVVAQVLDEQMEEKLTAAVSRLQRARAELAAGRAEVSEQERMLGQVAAQNYQSGDPGLLGLAMVLTSRNPTELTSQLGSVQSLLDKESGTLDRLDASGILLTLKEAEVQKARVEVAEQRAAAAENLERKIALEARAQQAENRVAVFTERRTQARNAAAENRAEDLQDLRELERERERISALLEQRAEAARRRAAAAAAAARAAETGSGAPAAPAPVVTGALTYPVQGWITSPYGMRFHPVYRRLSLHDGTDFGAACGTPIRAAAGGTVIATYYNSAYGNRVIMDNGYQRGVGLGTTYSHLSGYAASVGQRVARGDTIGYVGTTGASTGCHLHFMVLENGVTVDPMTWL